MSRPTSSTAPRSSASLAKTCCLSTAATGCTSRSTSASRRAAWSSPCPKASTTRARRVATKYMQTAREHFSAKGVHVDLIRLYGSMELAPLLGLADAVVDLVATGNTLRANRLRVVEEIRPISARLIVNQAALKLKRDAVQPLLDTFAKAVGNDA